MARLPAAQNRTMKNVFFCKSCGAIRRIDAKRILEGKIACRRCGKRKFRAIKKK